MSSSSSSELTDAELVLRTKYAENYEIKFQAGKGNTICAKRLIRAGEVIIEEDPLMLLPATIPAPLHNKDIDELCAELKMDARLVYGPLSIMHSGKNVQERVAALCCPDADASQGHLQELLARDPVTGGSLLHRFVKFLPSGKSVEDLRKYVIIVDTNSAGADNDALALYDTCSRLSHACLPNTKWSSGANGRRCVIATNDIPPGEEITVSYLHDFELLRSTAFRQERLVSSKYFTCLCDLCTRPVDTSRGFICPLVSLTSQEPCRGKVRVYVSVVPAIPSPSSSSAASSSSSSLTASTSAALSPILKYTFRCESCERVLPTSVRESLEKQEHMLQGAWKVLNEPMSGSAVVRDANEAQQLLMHYITEARGSLSTQHWLMSELDEQTFQMLTSYGSQHGNESTTQKATSYLMDRLYFVEQAFSRPLLKKTFLYDMIATDDERNIQRTAFRLVELLQKSPSRKAEAEQLGQILRNKKVSIDFWSKRSFDMMQNLLPETHDLFRTNKEARENRTVLPEQLGAEGGW